jgi:transposase
MMAGLWEIEADIRGQDPATRVTVRQEKSAASVAALFDLWEKELPRLSGKSKLAEAIRYATSRRAALERFLSDGRIEIDSNTVERAIRPQTITRNYVKRRIMRRFRGGDSSEAVPTALIST